MNNNQMMVQQETNSMMIIEGLKLDRVTDSMAKINQFQQVIQSQLLEGHDYGQAFYGSTKPSLLKPGAEKILMLLGLSSEYEIIERVQDYEEGFFSYTIKCLLTKNGQVITEGLGHCNSKEKKYDSDKQDKFMLGNTCLKMAKKRAQVDAALTVGSLSNIFTQDLEDMVQFNQSERVQTLNNGEAHNTKVNFGKHRGKTLGEIFMEDKSYIEWLKDNARDEFMKKAAAMILNKDKDGSQDKAVNSEKEVVDIETGEIQDESDLPWNNTSNEDIPF